MINPIVAMLSPRARLLLKSFVAAHQRLLKNGKTVQVAAHFDKHQRKDAQAVQVDHTAVKIADADKKADWVRLHQEQHVLHHVDKAKHEADLQKISEKQKLHEGLANYHTAERDKARASGDKAAESHHNQYLTHSHNKLLALHSKQIVTERKLAKVNDKLTGIHAAKESLWAGSGAVEHLQNQDVSMPNRDKLREKYSENQINETSQELFDRYEWGKEIVSGKKDFNEAQLQSMRVRMGQKYRAEVPGEKEYFAKVSEKNKLKEAKQSKERAHVTAANAILEKAKGSDKYRLTQKPFYNMANAERGHFKRVFGEGYEGQKKAKEYAKSINFVAQMAKEDRPITAKQKDWLEKIAAEHYVSYDKDADKTSKRTLAKDKVKAQSSYDDEPDMPMQREDGSWYDAETGLDITNPKYQRSYL